MKTLAELQAIRDKMKANVSNRGTAKDSDYKITVGMATCGIASGARAILTALTSEIASKSISNTVVTQTGCIGRCNLEPIIEVINPDGQKITYVKVQPSDVSEILTKHIQNGKTVDRLLCKE